MEIENKTRWHPAFCAAMELELMANKEGLTYDPEHNLSSEPLRIDLLIIKKEPDEVIENEIGTFFLGHNIVEYKSPDDKVNIDTFYKVLSYACLYKSDTGLVDEILDTDITITLIREQKPVKLLGQLQSKYTVAKRGKGIYQIKGMLFPMQIIVTCELEKSLHVWLKSLTRNMEQEDAEELLGRCDDLRGDSAEYEKAKSLVNLVSDVNDGLFKRITAGGEKMSNELKYMVLPELKEAHEQLANKDAELASSKAQLASKDAELASSKAEIESKDAEIQNSKAEIERLRRELAIAKAAKEL